MQISKVDCTDSHFPAGLRQLFSPPQAIYLIGTLPKGPYIAIAGRRQPTAYGQQVAYELAYELAQAGIVIVSGLSLGIAAIVHRAAMDAGGITVAVQARGLDKIYPDCHRQLAVDIIRRGAIISEYPAGTGPLRRRFIARNRLIAGLSLAVIVPEASVTSGCLHAVNFALEQGKQVMAVPGNITSPKSAGPNNIIKCGAIPVTGTSDVLAALDLEQVSGQPVKARGREEVEILSLLGRGVNNYRDLIKQSSLTAGQFANIITLMEITGKVRNLGAGNWVRR